MIDKDCEITQTTENGKWWVENGKYHELHSYDNVVDIYDYQVFEESIKFNALEMMGNKNPNYLFFDYKILDEKK